MKRVRTVLQGVVGSPYISNMYFDDVVATDDALERAGNFWNICEGVMVNDLAWFTETTVVRIDPVNGAITGSSSGAGQVGQGSGVEELLPPANQILVQWQTGVYLGGREVRGRTFIPALVDTANVDGVLNSTFRTTLITNITTWLGEGALPQVWSRANGAAVPVTGVTVGSHFAVLRSRRD